MSLPNLDEATFAELQDGLSAGLFTSVDLVQAYLARIAEANPLLKAVISTSPTALRHAAELDAERAAGKVRGILHGIPIGVKDNIETRAEDGMDTTAGSFALKGAVPPGDAAVIGDLRGAGAIILCKTNLAVWASYRGVAPGAWSPVGGQCTNPYYPNGSPSGSSSGSAVAVATSMCAAALGTETNGSIVAPANANAVCGVRPTVGLVSQAGVIPLARTKDTIGPMARNVTDAAHLLQAMVSGGAGQVSYTDSLRVDALAGQCIIFPQNLSNIDDYLGDYKRICFEAAIRTLEELGANVKRVDANIAEWHPILDDWDALGLTVATEFKVDLAAHLADYTAIPSGVRNLDDLITFTKNDARESPLGYEGQPRLEEAMRTRGLTDPAYLAARATQDRVGQLIAALLDEHGASAAIMPNWHTSLWAQAGWPQVLVPLGYLPSDYKTVFCTDKNEKQLDVPHNVLNVFPNQPFGITFAGAALSEATLLSYAYAFEQATQARKQSRPYAEAMPKAQLKDVVETGTE